MSAQQTGQLSAGLRIRIKEAHRRLGVTFTNLDRSSAACIHLDREGGWAVYNRNTGEVSHFYPDHPTNAHGWSPAKTNAYRMTAEIAAEHDPTPFSPFEYDLTP